MKRFHVFGLASFVLVLAIALQSSGQGKDKDKDKDKPFEVPKNAVSGTVKSVNEKKASFTITAKGAERTFLVDEKTEFWGPKGGDRGTGVKGLTDDCMAPGYEIKVMPRKDGKTAKDVFLPERKSSK
jgi:hypothetical protein